MSMNTAPRGERLHIALFGRRNAGKSSLVNAITGQDLAIVSEIPGTTTDPVYKTMELLPLGPVVFIDTPGLDDEGVLGDERIRKTVGVLNKTDIALIVADGMRDASDFSFEGKILDMTRQKGIPSIVVMNKQDMCKTDTVSGASAGMDMNTDEEEPTGVVSGIQADICVSARTGYHIEKLKELIGQKIPAAQSERQLVADLLSPGDFVVLVIPIDSSAPKGRLILPQQQVMRDILEAGASAIACRDTELAGTLASLGRTPRLVITDSQAFAQVARDTPESVPLTSFSILFSRYKGDLEAQVDGVARVQELGDGDTILMAEGCTHHRQCEDIGTVKLPRWIQEYTGKKLNFETSSGGGFPEDLTRYKMVVHCGGCMLNPREMAHRINQAKEQQVPIVNYGTLIAFLKGILKRSIAPLPGYRDLLP